MEKGELRWWGELPNFSLPNVNAETGKETKGMTFLTFLRKGLHHWNNEEFWKIRSWAHTSCRLSSKCIFWLNFLCTDFLITDTRYLFLSSVCGWGSEGVLPSVLQPSSPVHQRQLSPLRTIWENTGRTGRTGISGNLFGTDILPLNYAGIHLLSKAVFSQGERLPSLCLIMHTRVEKAQLSSVKHKHLSSSCLHRKEFHSLCYSRAVVPFDNSRSHTHSVCPYFVQVLCDTCC